MKQPIFNITQKNIFKTFLTTVFMLTVLVVAQIYIAFHQHHHNSNRTSSVYFDNQISQNHNLSTQNNHDENSGEDSNCLVCNIAQFFKIAINNKAIIYFFSLILLNFSLKKYKLIFLNYCFSKQFSRAPPQSN